MFILFIYVLQCLRISNSVKQQYTTGEIVSLVSVECQRIQDAFAFSQELLSFFLIMIFGLYELWNPMGISFLGCLGAILTIFFLNMLFGKLQQNYFEEILSLKGKRIKVFNEVIKGIKVNDNRKHFRFNKNSESIKSDIWKIIIILYL